jgi:hypothetical protein
VSAAELRADVVILACAISAGIHGALAPGHFSEGAGAGSAFAVAAVALAGIAVWLTARPGSRLALAAAACAFVGLLASYALAISSGLPVLHPEPEPIDALALVTKAIEAFGLAAASSLLWRPATTSNLHPKGTLT